MGKFVIHLVVAVIWVAVVAAGAWFGAPLVWAHIQAGEAAKVTVKAQAGSLAADTASANRQQKSCTDEIKASMAAGAAIQKAAQVQPPAVGQPRPMITADQIKAAMQ